MTNPFGAGPVRAAIPAAAFLLATLLATLLVRPWEASPVGFDSAASVVHFQRIVTGQRLEAFVTTTPKPLLTAVYGVLHALGGWSLIEATAIVAFGILAAGAAALAARVAGPLAGAFAGVGIAGSGLLLTETAYAYSVPLAGVLWAAAGLAATDRTPRYGLAGAALFLAALARVETLLVVAIVGVVLTAITLGRRRLTWLPPVPRRAGLVLLGFAALPVMLVHDWLLTGDPWFWLVASARYSEAAGVVGGLGSALDMVVWIARRYAADPGPAALALVGGVWLVARHRWAMAVGLAALGPGIAAFLVLLAWRGTYVSTRYIAPVDVAVIVAAAVGVGVAGRLVGHRLAPSLGTALRPRWARLAATATAVGIASFAAIVLGRPWGPADAAVVDRIATERALHANAVLVEPSIAVALDGLSGGVAAPGGVGRGTSVDRPPVLLVPQLLRPRLALDLDVPLDLVAGLDAAALDGPASALAPGRVVYHDVHGGQGDEAFRVLRIEAPAVLGDVRLVPLLADPARGAWLVRVEARTPS